MANFDYRKAVKENKATFHASLTEGQFSWMTQDTDQQIGSEPENTITVYMHDNKGNTWREDNYEGYGEFGGMDYYELLAKMNGYTEDDIERLSNRNIISFPELRNIGVKVAFGDLKPLNAGPVLFPALTEDPRYPSGHDFTQEAENDPNQSWYSDGGDYDDTDYFGDEDDDNSWEDQYGDDEEELEEGTTNKMKVSEFKAKIKEMIMAEMGENPEDPYDSPGGKWLEEASDKVMKRMNDLVDQGDFKMMLAGVDGVISSLKKEGFEDEDIADYIVDSVERKFGFTIRGLQEAKDEEVTDTETEVDVDVEEPTPSDEPVGDGGISVSQNADADLTGVEKEVQDNLEAAMEAAKKLGDEKLQKQIGNSLTFFTRQHVVKENKNLKETLLLQKRTGIITEAQYKAKLKEGLFDKFKKDKTSPIDLKQVKKQEYDELGLQKVQIKNKIKYLMDELRDHHANYDFGKAEEVQKYVDKLNDQVKELDTKINALAPQIK